MNKKCKQFNVKGDDELINQLNFLLFRAVKKNLVPTGSTKQDFIKKLISLNYAREMKEMEGEVVAKQPTV